MSKQYIFNQAGCIPGVPGIFGNCRVDIDDEGNLHQSPLVPVVVEEVAPVEEAAKANGASEASDAPTNVASEPLPEPQLEPEPAPVEAPAPEAQPEQPSSPPAFNGG